MSTRSSADDKPATPTSSPPPPSPRSTAPRGRRTYARRAGAIEPVFAQIKHNRKIRTISRRGLTTADSEWKLICATRNLLKLFQCRGSIAFGLCPGCVPKSWMREIRVAYPHQPRARSRAACLMASRMRK
ncbi:transposase [Nocardioides vastitatis]|uniref:Transposase n=1 Tax=Nocardioides vastitatis TaxID=2568655 RepID=A0ABW0ZLN5_9ACTN|nr:hypothetical protein E7Z54_08865 [Nocardioides sp.]